MRVKTCIRCPYSPRDLGEHHASDAENFLCIQCPNQGLLCLERGPYYRETVVHPDRTNYAKRHGGIHAEAL
jgi:hypothetical protein